MKTIHSDRNRSERLWGGGGRSAAPGAYTSVCEEREHRPTSPRSRAVDLVVMYKQEDSS